MYFPCFFVFCLLLDDDLFTYTWLQNIQSIQKHRFLEGTPSKTIMGFMGLTSTPESIKYAGVFPAYNYNRHSNNTWNYCAMLENTVDIGECCGYWRILWDIGEYCGYWRILWDIGEYCGYWRILWDIGEYCGILENTVLENTVLENTVSLFLWVDVLVFLWIICLYSCCFFTILVLDKPSRK